jgi:hypothetical protein
MTDPDRRLNPRRGRPHNTRILGHDDGSSQLHAPPKESVAKALEDHRHIYTYSAAALPLVDASPPVGETLRYRLGKRGNLRPAALGKPIMGHGTKPALEVGGLLEQQPDATRIPLRQEVPPAARSDVAAENLVQLVRRW